MHHLHGSLDANAGIVAVIAAVFLIPLSVVRFILPRATEEFMTHSKPSLEKSLEMVRGRRTAIEKTTSSEYTPERRTKSDLLEAMITADNISDEKMAAQLTTYMLAGNETTSATLSLERQDLLRSKVTDALRPMLERGVTEISSLGPILERLPYLNGVVHEALQLYPTVPLTSRTAIRDTHVLGQFVPKGTTIYISLWQRQRDPKVWGPDAWRFRPERWILDEIGPDGLKCINQGHNLYDFITFIYGPRNCIGQRFAKAELRCLVAALAFHFRWTTDATQMVSSRCGLLAACHFAVAAETIDPYRRSCSEDRTSQCEISGNDLVCCALTSKHARSVMEATGSSA